MLISHNNKFIFLKTKKTAGTSVEVFFQEYCLPPHMAGMTEAQGDQTRTDAIVSEYGVVGYRGKRDASKQLYNHMSASEVRAYDPKAFEAYLKFTTIRNPFDKVVSFFWHLHRNEPNVKNAEFSEVRDAFINWVACSGVKPRDQDVYKIDGKFIADFYIRYENLQRDLRKVCELVGIEYDASKLGKLKSGLRLKSQPYQDYYDEKTKQSVSDFFESELAFFSYEF